MITIPIRPGTPVYGKWCNTCQLPSGYEVHIHALVTSGVTRVGTRTGCVDCEETP